METKATSTSHKVLFFNTLAFTVCFAAWMFNGVLVAFLAANQIPLAKGQSTQWDPVTMGWLIGIPVLTGSIFRLPAGILTDKYGGKPIYTGVLLLSAIPMFLLSYANSILTFALCSFGFGLAGTSFAVGIAFSSVWYPKAQQGLALGIFGAGNAGAAVTTLLAPSLLAYFTHNMTHLEGWRTLPKVYAAMLVVMAILFFLFTENKKPANQGKTLTEMLHPLKSVRVWRFGLYYFLVFGCFVAFAQWLVPYFVSVYMLSLFWAGLFASLFSFPSGVIRALGGWMSDKWGARRVMYWVLGSSVALCALLIVPKMVIYSPGQGVIAKFDGVVTDASTHSITVGKLTYPLTPMPKSVVQETDDRLLVFPTKDTWQEGLVKKGQSVKKNALLAKGVTRIFFQANVWIFAFLVILLGTIWGIGKAAVYKHIPDYFPNEEGVVGGMVGVLGGLGGFFCPIVFGYLLKGTGLWTSCWMFMLLLSVICLIWMHYVIQSMMRKEQPELMRKMEKSQLSEVRNT